MKAHISPSILAALLGVVFCIDTIAATVSWTNTSGGNWEDPGNWSPNQVPGAGDTANITAIGTYTVTINSDVTVAVLNLGGASGEQTIVVASGLLNNAAGGTISGNGVLNVEGESDLRGTVTVEAGGEMNFKGSGSKFIFDLILSNQGTVNHLEGTLLADSDTAISSAGLWDVQGPATLRHFSGATPPTFTNTGTLRRSGAAGTALISDFALTNQGIIESAAGTLTLPANYESSEGTLRLSGGHLGADGILLFSGGVLEGSGSYGGTEFIGGTISPGVNGPGRITFTSGLNLGEEVSLSIDAKGATPIVDHDQIAVTGGVNITNSSLSFTPTASLPVGTELVVIENDGSDLISGFFGGYADGTLFDGNQELYRTWYERGTGNDFAITRSADGVQLTAIELNSEGQFVFSGLGTNSVTYTIFATPKIPTNIWEDIGAATTDPGGKFEFTDPDAHLFNMRFYRTLGP